MLILESVVQFGLGLCLNVANAFEKKSSLGFYVTYIESKGVFSSRGKMPPQNKSKHLRAVRYCGADGYRAPRVKSLAPIGWGRTCSDWRSCGGGAIKVLVPRIRHRGP